MTVPDKAHHIVHARTYHSKVLKKAPGNAYAAHGLGLVLAEEFGRVEDARAVLQAIREGSGDKPDEILINIAHLFTAQVRYARYYGYGWSFACGKAHHTPPPTPPQQGQRNAAIHCYETFLKKRLLGTAGQGDPLLHGKVLESVAHAHYLDKRFEVRTRQHTHLHLPSDSTDERERESRGRVGVGLDEGHAEQSRAERGTITSP